MQILIILGSILFTLTAYLMAEKTLGRIESMLTANNADQEVFEVADHVDEAIWSRLDMNTKYLIEADYQEHGEVGGDYLTSEQG